MEINSPRLYLYSNTDLCECEVHPAAKGRVLVFTTKSPYRESPNQDAAAVIPFDEYSCVLVVADGAGGLPHGAQASAVAIKSIERSLRQAVNDDTPLRGAIIDGIEKANQELVAMGTGSATTIAVAEIHNNTVRPYHVGDSQIMVFGQRGKVKLLTKSHSPVGYALEAGLLDEEEAMYHEQRHVVSNAIGSTEMHIEVGSVLNMSTNDTFLIASDGLYDNLYVREIVEICRKGPLRTIGKELARQCIERMSGPGNEHPSKPDDLTFAVYRIHGGKKKIVPVEG